VRALDPGRSSFSCLSLSFVYSLYNTITGRRKKEMSPFYTEGDIPLRFVNSKFGILHRGFACLSEFFIEHFPL